jgi:hypothetical protein
MDLGTLKENLASGKYDTFEACFRDLAQIWDNCKTYNYSPDMFKLATRLERMSRREIVKFCAQYNLQSIAPPVSPDPKIMRKRSIRVAGRPYPE